MPIVSPPEIGIGVEWLFLLLGKSKKLNFLQILFIIKIKIGVNKIVNKINS